MIQFNDVAGLVAGELRFLRIKEVCKVLGVSRQQLHRMRQSGAFINPKRISANVIAFRSDDMLEWINSRETIAHQDTDMPLGTMEAET